MKRLSPNRRGGIECPTGRRRPHGCKDEGPITDYVGMDAHSLAKSDLHHRRWGPTDRTAKADGAVALG